MVKHTQTIRWLLPTNCLSMFDHLVGLALKEVRKIIHVIFFSQDLSFSQFIHRFKIGIFEYSFLSLGVFPIFFNSQRD